MTYSRCLTATQQRHHHPPDTEYNRIEVVVYSLTSHIPIYYKELPGNMPDCSTIELIMKELEHTGFFASKTIGVDFDPLQAMNNYGMRDEQEKCFALQKGPLGHDRLRTWSEGGKEAVCSYISSDSYLIHTYDPYGRRTMCCARSSLQPMLCSSLRLQG